MEAQQLLEKIKALCNSNRFSEALSLAKDAKASNLRGFDGVITAITIHQLPRVTSENKIDYYNALSVPKTASFEEISTSYKRKSLLVHPDRLQGLNISTEVMQTLSAIKDTLNNSRSAYDATMDPKTSRPAAAARPSAHSTPTRPAPAPAAAATSHRTPTPKPKFHYSAPPTNNRAQQKPQTTPSPNSYNGTRPPPHFTSTAQPKPQPRPTTSTSYHHYSAPPTTSPRFVPRSVRRKMGFNEDMAAPSKRHHK